MKGLLVAAGAAAVALATSAPPSVDQAFTAFWAAATVDQAATAARDVVASGVDFQTAVARLKQGRSYAATAPRGVQTLVRKSGGQAFPYTIDVPASYDPAKRYQVRVQLHGGVGRPEAARRGDGSIGTLAGAEQIYVLPQAWNDFAWWNAAQDENLPAILDHVKRTYNVDENRVVLSGVSDGGTGAYYVAMRDTTPYASFLPLNGHILVLRNRDLGLSGALFPHNLTNKPFFIVNGGADPLYPAAEIEPLVQNFAAGGLRAVWAPQADAGHTTAWWPVVKDDFEDFVRAHPREPHPARLSWTTDSTTSRNRAHWLVIDRLAAPGAGPALPDINDIAAGEELSFGVRTIGMRVTDVQPGSNASAVGLQAGDLVTAVNGRTLPEGLDLTEYLGIFDPGQALTLAVTRGGASKELKGNYAPVRQARVTPLFTTTRPTGRVDLVREGNTVTAVTRGVGAFTLLLSPDVIDFAMPVTVVADGQTVFNGPVQPSVETLLTWAARDNDRTMLYGAALTIALDQR
ncbi:MAG: PDZ domain-containing protein [Vicinamibacterales bacterium]